MKTTIETEAARPAMAKAKGNGLIVDELIVDSSAKLEKRRMLKMKVTILTGKMIRFLRKRVAVGWCEDLPTTTMMRQKVRRMMNSTKN
jgi:hypothetical protein